MEQINNKMAIILLVVVVLSTLITTFAFFSIQQTYNVKYTGPVEDSNGKVSINMVGNVAYTEPIGPVEAASPGKVSINIK